MYATLLDFGSTYTKVVCVDMKKRQIVLTDKFPSTVNTDARIALNKCFKVIKEAIGKEKFEKSLKLSTSSAAGGLRIAVSGLTRSLSSKAGRNACFGAGGKIECSVSGLIRQDDINNINESKAEILLLCGGYEKGNSSYVLHNADIVSKSNLKIPVIYAGNSEVAKEVKTMFTRRGKECFVAANIIPDVGKMNIGPTVNIIRNLFMNRITNMKGVGEVQLALDEYICPTPASVLSAGTLLFEGTENESGIGPYMMVDIGGATTDVYSFIENCAYKNAKNTGLIEPTSKRTVEGDMGMRESSIALINEVGIKEFSNKCGVLKDVIEETINKFVDEHEYIAYTKDEKNIDFNIASTAVRISARRHAGMIDKELHEGCRLIQYGKNLTGIKTVIGTGGVLVNIDREDAEEILNNVQQDQSEIGKTLLPAKIKAFLDEDYIFFAAGLLKNYDVDCAMKIMKKSIGLL